MQIFFSLLLIFFLTALLYFNPRPFARVLNYFENLSYDFFVRRFYKPLSGNEAVVIIDIDDQSLLAEGRWPWSRSRMATLTEALYQSGAKVVAFDVMFPESEPVADELFSEAIAHGNSILSFVLKPSGISSGQLPQPLFTLTPEESDASPIPDMPIFISNIPLLQKSAKGGGFINSRSDLDGVIRLAPLLIRQGDEVFPSLSLAAVRLFQPEAKLSLRFEKYGRQNILEAIERDAQLIEVNPWGEILIPFRGPPYSIPYISATDVLRGKAKEKEIAGKIAFIGSSGTAMGDLVASAMAPVFPGIEIHAQIAASILDGYSPYIPTWGSGTKIAQLVIFGGGAAILLPFLGPVAALVLTLFAAAILTAFDATLWIHYHIVFSSLYTVFALFTLMILNEAAGYSIEKRNRAILRSIFGHYIPLERVEWMAQNEQEYSLEGETKPLTVLFADIRNFTTFSEGLSASELKLFLNNFLSAMTEAIFQHKGTIDKYIGDLVMAFWGAPIEDPQHEENGVLAALEMQKRAHSFIPPLAIGIGVNSGSMNVGDMGSKFRRAYTVLGDAVNVGSRLEGATKFYHVDILVGEETYQKTNKTILYYPVDKVQLKGKQKAIYIYEPIGLISACTEEQKQQALARQEALNAYFQQNWDLAEKKFTELKAKGAEALYCEEFLKRIARFRTSPPPSGWDGSYRLDSK